jgi:hypothetical protein
MITAIYVKDNTKLTIVTQEDLLLEQMGSSEPPAKLFSGQNNSVDVGRGVFRVQSAKAVTVTASTQLIHVGVTPFDKDGGPIDEPKRVVATPQAMAEAAKMAEATKAVIPPTGFMPELDARAVRKFLFPAMDANVP